MPPAPDADLSLRSAQLAGGISQQPPHLRFPGQVEAASNVVFDVADGIRKRAGSVYVKTITGLTLGNDYALHAIDRDDSERYVVVYGDSGGLLKVFHEDGTEATVSITAAAATYLALNSPTTRQLRLRTVADYTFILNTTVAAGLVDGPTYELTHTWRDYDVMTSNTVAQNTYHQTTGDVAGFPQGFYKYNTGTITFGTYKFPEITGGTLADPSGFWDGGGPYGFGIRFQRRSRAFTGGTWTAATRTLVTTDCFLHYSPQDGDELHITGGTGFTPGWYRIESVSSSTTCVLRSAAGLSGSNQTNVTGGDIGVKYDVRFPATSTTLTDMYAIAAYVQSKMHQAGAMDALCSWTETNTQTGYFTITNPWGGIGSTIAEVTAPSTGTDLSAAGQPFNPTGTNTSGTGPVTGDGRSLAPDLRWTRVAESGASNATPDQTKMPVQMVRTVIGPPATFTVDVVTWNSRTTGDEDSNPAPSIWTNTKKISDIAFYKNRLGFSGGENVVFSRTGDLFNFFLDDPANLKDTDPIDVSLSSDQVTITDFMVLFRDSITIFTTAGRQFDLASRDTFTSSTAAFTASTQYNTLSVRPRPIGGLLYFVGPGDKAGEMYEAYYDETILATEATQVSAHVPDLLPTTIRSIAAHANTRQVFVLSEEGSYGGKTIYGYRSHWTGLTKQQSAWTTWAEVSTAKLCDIVVVHDKMFTLVQKGTQFALEYFPLTRPVNDQSIGHSVFGDRKITLSGGTFAAGATTWTLPNSTNDSSLTTVVIGSTGAIVTAANDGTHVVITGNYSAETVIACRPFAATVTFTRPYLRDARGSAELDTTLVCKRVTTTHLNSGTYTLTQNRAESSDIDNVYTPATNTASGTFRTFIAGDVEKFNLKLSSSSVRPMTITGLEYQTDIAQPPR